MALFHPKELHVGRLVRTPTLFLPKHNLLQREASVCHPFPTEQSTADKVEIQRTRNSPTSESTIIGTNVVDLGSRLTFLFRSGYGKTSITQNRRVRIRSTRITSEAGLLRDVHQRWMQVSLWTLSAPAIGAWWALVYMVKAWVFMREKKKDVDGPKALGIYKRIQLYGRVCRFE